MFDPATLAAMRAHAEAEYPSESCGFVIGGAYLPRRNTAERPELDFRIAPQAYVAAQRRGDVQAIIHSHPEGPPHPSESDMAAQIETALPWGIVFVHEGRAKEIFWWGDGAPKEPLIGRVFRHGITDCYALVRDYYANELDASLPELPRRAAWWENGGNLLEEHFQEFGFRRLGGSDELEPRDAILAQFGGGVVNHCGVYIGQGLILHHLANRLSRRDPVEPWRRYITHYLRYDP